jgi:crotonobetainyl-CoA:carnitine CoA-transferase CaiB-like acyl-CoA transferase
VSEDGELSLEEIREISRRLSRANEVNPDPNTSMVIMSAAMLGLYAQRTGQGGQRIWLDMLGANAYANWDDFVQYRGQPERAVPDADLYGIGPLSRLYECQEGWVYLELMLEKEWQLFATQIDSSDLAQDQRFSSRDGREANGALLTQLLSELFASETAQYWEDELSTIGLGCVVADGPAAAEFWEVDEHAHQNGLVAPVVHGKWGDMLRHGPMWKTHRSTLTLGPAPLLGEQTDAILEELGYGAEEIAQLHADGIVAAEVPEAVPTA